MRQRALFACLLVWLAIGCSHFDTTRVPAARGTLGEEIVRVFCERMASDANPTDVMGLRWKPVCRGEVAPPADSPRRLVVLMENRQRLARALDQVLPDELHDDLAFFLGELLPLYDPPTDRLPRSTRLLAELLDTLTSDREAMESLARIGTREGYRPLRLALGVVRPFLAYPEFDELAELALRVISDEPDDPSDGLAAEQWRELQRALALEMATLEPPDPVPAGEETTLEMSRRLLFTQDDQFGSGGPAQWLLLRDVRGIALPAAGAVVAPFVDMDSDGLADVDAMGRFVDANGEVMGLPRPFRILGETGIPRDTGGRALRGDGSRFYEYIDVDRTLLAAAVRETRPLFDAATPTALQLARGLPAMLGPDTMHTETFGAETLTYVGPDTAQGSLFDVVYALGELMHRDTTDRALALVEALLRDHDRDAAGIIAAADYMLDRGDEYPDAALPQPNVFWDDLLAIGADYAHEPGLLEAVIRSFADPRSAQLGPVYASFMRHRDRVTYDPANPNGAPIGFPLDEPVDRSRPDVEGNESMFQRTIALIDAFNGLKLCNREGAKLRMHLLGLDLNWPLIGGARECELIEIDNVGEAYALSIIGQYDMGADIKDGFLRDFLLPTARLLGINVDDVLVESSGIEGLTTHPTPRAMSRLVFWGLDDKPGMTCAPGTDAGNAGCNSLFAAQLFAPMEDRHGNNVIDTYHGTIFAWETPGFFEGMAPLIEVLHRPQFRTADDGTYRFGHLITTLHRHWGTREHWYTQRANPNGSNFSYQDNARSYEENIADGLAEGRLLERLQRAATTSASITIDGRDGLRVLSEAAIDMLDPAASPGLTTRDGRTQIAWNDGSRQHPVTPMLLVLDALAHVDRDMDSDPDRRDAWRAARNRLATQFLETNPLGNEATFANQRARSILLVVLPFIRERLAAHREAGDLVEWARDITPDTEELLRSPLAAAGIRFLDRVQDDAEARDALSRLVGYLVDEASTNDAFAATLYGGADALQLLEDDETMLPLVHALSQAFAPDALDFVAGTDDGELDIDGSVATDSLGLIRAIQDRDRPRLPGGKPALRRVLANLVQLTDPDDGRTPLEEILDVIGEINRVTPGAGGSFDADDYEETIGQARGFLLDERRGLERLYDVVQEREIR